MNKTLEVLIWLLVMCIMLGFITSPLAAATSFIMVSITYFLVREKKVPEETDKHEDASKE
ncbi:hypothetical protein [Nitrosomonas sp.]|uniref:hypothetical protein n=1 Tax=Nitrosomonas sp. TaxID=42353 RepID=UPI002851AEC3|nr:hypothetical protein [Nitrosomonas sp.]MDR4515076.1 hypothetical protein [Nitrosomonas sp.]